MLNDSQNSNHVGSSDLSENGDNSLRSTTRKSQQQQQQQQNISNNSTSNESCPNKPSSHSSKNGTGDHLNDEMLTRERMRKISTPPPLPHILDNLIQTANGNHSKPSSNGGGKFNRLLINQAELSKLDALHQHHQQQHHMSGCSKSSKQQQQQASITTSIRETAGGGNKPVRVNHGLPPPPPVVVVSTISNRQSLNGTPVVCLNSNEYLTSVVKTTTTSGERGWK